ncbi:MAG: TVP38/TMEM64 family protein [Proteobacteria bacterium]|nr:TVP38/TMEM64 family protein [Pseudomonadota bacterium]
MTDNESIAETIAETSSGARKLAVKRLLPFAVLIAALIVTFSLDLHQYLSFDSLKENRETILEWRSSNAVLAALLFVLVYAAAIAISLPGAIWLTIASGFLFGTLQGGLLVVFAATLGATIIFLAARYAFADFFHAKVSGLLKQVEEGFRKDAVSYLLFLRFVPVFPFWLVNLVPAVLGVSLPAYVIATFFGIIPGTMVFASLGNGIGHLIDQGRTPDLGIIFDLQVLGPLLALALLSLIPVAYKHRSAFGIGKNKAGG